MPAVPAPPCPSTTTKTPPAPAARSGATGGATAPGERLGLRGVSYQTHCGDDRRRTAPQHARAPWPDAGPPRAAHRQRSRLRQPRGGAARCRPPSTGPRARWRRWARSSCSTSSAAASMITTRRPTAWSEAGTRTAGSRTSVASADGPGHADARRALAMVRIDPAEGPQPGPFRPERAGPRSSTTMASTTSSSAASPRSATARGGRRSTSTSSPRPPAPTTAAWRQRWGRSTRSCAASTPTCSASIPRSQDAGQRRRPRTRHRPGHPRHPAGPGRRRLPQLRARAEPARLGDQEIQRRPRRRPHRHEAPRRAARSTCRTSRPSPATRSATRRRAAADRRS